MFFDPSILCSSFRVFGPSFLFALDALYLVTRLSLFSRFFPGSPLLFVQGKILTILHFTDVDVNVDTGHQGGISAPHVVGDVFSSISLGILVLRV